jgi:hypothetical protein
MQFLINLGNWQVLPLFRNKCPWVSLKSKYSIDSRLYLRHLFPNKGSMKQQLQLTLAKKEMKLKLAIAGL